VELAIPPADQCHSPGEGQGRNASAPCQFLLSSGVESSSLNFLSDTPHFCHQYFLRRRFHSNISIFALCEKKSHFSVCQKCSVTQKCHKCVSGQIRSRLGGTPLPRLRPTHWLTSCAFGTRSAEPWRFDTRAPPKPGALRLL